MKAPLVRLISFALSFATVRSDEVLDLPSDPETSSWSKETKALVSADRKFMKELENIRATYRGRLAAVMELSDKIEILTFEPELIKYDDEDKIPEGRRFNLSPYSAFLQIKSRRSLVGDDLAAVKRELTAVLRNPDAMGGGAFCHDADCGIVVYGGGKRLFWTSFSWGCQNYFVRYPDSDVASWVGLSSQSGLERVLERLLQ